MALFFLPLLMSAQGLAFDRGVAGVRTWDEPAVPTPRASPHECSSSLEPCDNHSTFLLNFHTKATGVGKQEFPSRLQASLMVPARSSSLLGHDHAVHHAIVTAWPLLSPVSLVSTSHVSLSQCSFLLDLCTGVAFAHERCQSCGALRALGTQAVSPSCTLPVLEC